MEAAILDLNGGYFQYRDDRSLRLHLCADERDFTTRSGNSGHYLDFGSEYLFNLAIRLVDEYEAKRALRTTGAPTILVFDIPMAMICAATLEEFAGSVLEYLFCELVEDLEAHALGPGAGSALSLTRDLPPETLTGHYHPERFYHSHQR